MVAARASFHFGSVAYFLARLAATLGDHQAADALYADATRRDEQAGAAIWVVRDLRHHGELLLERGDVRQADDLLDRAANGARLAGLERVLEKSPPPTTGYAPTGVQLPARGPDIAATERSTPARAKRKQDPVGPSVFRTGAGR